MVLVEVSHTFPISVAEAFAYITYIKNWPKYWPDFIRVEHPDEARWNSPGDKVTIVIKLLNRERALHMELKEFQQDTRVAYVSQQQGLPDVRHERHFKPVPTGCEYRLVVAYEPRQGFTSLFDRLLVKRSVERALRKTVQNLDRVFQQRRTEP
jgi:hypothetical protein